jgi:hypothetical protein
MSIDEGDLFPDIPFLYTFDLIPDLTPIGQSIPRCMCCSSKCCALGLNTQ